MIIFNSIIIHFTTFFKKIISHGSGVNKGAYSLVPCRFLKQGDTGRGQNE
jgi:hypothetical protein